jgi:hypothetical protein
LKALTLWRPWAWSILHLPSGLGVEPKRIENRPWGPPKWIIGQRIALHSGKTFDADGAQYIHNCLRAKGIDDLEINGRRVATQDVLFDSDQHPQGIVGVATIQGWFLGDGNDPRPDNGQRIWAFGPWCWVLDDVRALKEPVTCRGMQKLWDVPEHVARAVEDRLGQPQVPESGRRVSEGRAS